MREGGGGRGGGGGKWIEKRSRDHVAAARLRGERVKETRIGAERRQAGGEQ